MAWETIWGAVKPLLHIHLRCPLSINILESGATQPARDYSADYGASLRVPFGAFSWPRPLKLETNNDGAEQRAPSLTVSSGKIPSLIYYLPLNKAGCKLRDVAKSFSSHRQGYLLKSLFEGPFDAAKQPSSSLLGNTST